MIKILQIGEGNFLRAFAEYHIELAKQNGNDVSVTLCQPRTNSRIIDALKAQDGRYNVLIRGLLNGERRDDVFPVTCAQALDSVSDYDRLIELACDRDLKVVISNTTEAGICYNPKDTPEAYPDITFPAKLVLLLFRRFLSGGEGIVLLPCELIENNGEKLRECIINYAVLWQLGEDFIAFVEDECSFCNTLVDRIVTGHAEYKDDNCAVMCEPYCSWLIQADGRAREVLSVFDGIDSIQFADDLSVYRTRKVKILNGVHTMSVFTAMLSGFEIVRDMVQDERMSAYINKGLKEEILPTISLPADELEAYAGGVLERFNNPFIDHKLKDISLNSVAKFKARCMVSIEDYYAQYGKPAHTLLFALAALIYYYKHFDFNDVDEVKAAFDEAPESIVNNTALWGADLKSMGSADSIVMGYYNEIGTVGIEKAVERLLSE
jgi:tagaturonate reductase